MQEALFLLLLLFFIELAETAQYRGHTFNEAINNLYTLYKRHILKFVLFHSSLAYLLYVTATYDLVNIWTISIILTKMADIATKFYLFKKIDQGGYFNIEQFGVPDVVLDWKLRYLSVIVYTGLFIPALGELI